MSLGRTASLARAGGLALAAALLVQPAAAQDTGARAACADAFEATQVKRRSGLLKAARRSALTCSQELCSQPVRDECTKWLGELEASVPSILVTGKDARGRDLVDARLFINDEPVAQRLDGRPVELDPGEYEVRIEPNSGQPVAQEIVVTAGERGRVIALHLRGSSGGEPGDSDRGLSPLVWVGFGLGGAGLLVGAITGGIALGHECSSGGCVDGSKRDEGLVIAGVSTASFILAGVGIGIAVLGLTVGRPKSATSGALARGNRGMSVLRVGPGAVALEGTF